MKKSLIARVAGAVMAVSVGLGITQVADADAYSPTPSPSVVSSSALYDDTPTRQTSSVGSRGDGSSVAALATKLGLKEQTVSDALVAVREQEQSAGVLASASGAGPRANGRGARQAAVAKALADELRIDINTVSTSLTALQAERKAVRADTGL